MDAMLLIIDLGPIEFKKFHHGLSSLDAEDVYLFLKGIQPSRNSWLSECSCIMPTTEGGG